MSDLVALDTNIIVYYFDTESTFHKKSVGVMEHMYADNSKLIISVIVYCELISFPHLPKQAIKDYQDFLRLPDLCYVVDVDTTIAKTTAYLRRKYRIKTPDALIIASAIESGAEVFVTNDERLKILQEIEVKTLNDFVVRK